MIKIPDKINELVKGKEYTTDDIGKSGSEIRIYDDIVLKVEKYTRENDEIVNVMNWLNGKLPVPKVICYESDNEYQYLLMTRAEGQMSFSQYYFDHPDELVKVLAESLKLLWTVDISDCPRERDLDSVLAEARYRLDNGLVDTCDAEPDTYGEGGFESPRELLEWLEDNKPDYEPVLSHGDFCVPNIFIKDGKLSGLIDLGRTGVCDKWNDIALCYRSLKHNFDGTFGKEVREGFDPAILFDALGIKPDWGKIRYYILLDELF